MVSASTLVTSAQTRSIFSKPVRSLSRTTWIIQAMNGSGSRVTSASQGLIENRMTAVMTIISTSVAKSSRCSDRKTQMRSVSRADARHQVAGALAAEVFQRQPQQVLVGGRAQVGADALATPAPGCRCAPSRAPRRAGRSRAARRGRALTSASRWACRSGTGSARCPSAAWSGRAAPGSRRSTPASAESRRATAIDRAWRSATGGTASSVEGGAVEFRGCRSGIRPRPAGAAPCISGRYRSVNRNTGWPVTRLSRCRSNSLMHAQCRQVLAQRVAPAGQAAAFVEQFQRADPGMVMVVERRDRCAVAIPAICHRRGRGPAVG